MALAACGGDTAQQASGPQSHANKALLPTKWSAAPIDTQGTVVAVLSCPTTQFCMGIDKVHGRAVAWQGGTWTAAVVIVPPGTALTGVACGSAQSCFAVGSHGTVVAWNGTSWAAPMKIEGNDVAALDSFAGSGGDVVQASRSVRLAFPLESTATDPTLTDIDCTNEELCVAIDTAGNELTWNGSWSEPRPLEPSRTALVAVSCWADSFCVAVDSASRASVWNGGSWSLPKAIGTSAMTTGISCPTLYLCEAVDNAGNVVERKGTVWQTPQAIDSGHHLTGISCASPTSCVAVDDAGNQLSWDGTSWSAPAPSGSNSTITSVSCVDDLCVGSTSTGSSVEGPA